MKHTFFSTGTLPKLILQCIITGMINHFVRCVHKNIIRCLYNKQTDYYTGNRIKNRKS